MHSTSWFSIEGLASVLIPKIGALAGTSYADLLFTYAAAKTIKTSRGLLIDEGLENVVDLDAMSEVLGIHLTAEEKALTRLIYETSFVDDGAWPVFARTSKIADCTRRAIVILDKVALVFAYKVNYKKGKTMVVIRFYGKDSKNARADFFNEHKGQIKFDAWAGPNKTVPKTLLSAPVYKHMGSWTDCMGSRMPDIKARTGSMLGSYRDIKSKIVRNPTIPEKHRLTIVVIYLVSKGFYNAGTWRALKVAEARLVHVSLMRIYRGVLRVDCPGCEHLTDDEVIARLKCQSPLSTVTYLRISLCVRLLVKSHYGVLSLLAASFGAPGSWLSAVHSDLNRLASVSEKLAEMRDSSTDRWVALIRQYPKNFLKCKPCFVLVAKN